VNSTGPNADDLARYLLEGIRRVQQELGWTGPAPRDVHERFADLLDSMGLVEFLLQVADDCGTTPEAIEACVQRQFGTIAELATAMQAAGLSPRGQPPSMAMPSSPPSGVSRPGFGFWFGATTAKLPATVQAAEEIDAILQRPSGWLRKRAGIESRRLWGTEDPLVAAIAAGRECLSRAGLRTGDVGALLVTSEAPPLLLGLAATLQHRLGLLAGTPALEVGGACTGFLAALWFGRPLLPRTGPILVIAVEAPSRLLQLEPGPAGEAAALFGDGAAACILCDQSVGDDAVPVMDVVVGADGSGAHLLGVERTTNTFALRMRGQALAERAVRVMADRGHALLKQHGLALAEVRAVLAHGGNGRMPALVARRLGYPAEHMWSETARVGNLGSATLPAAWAKRGPVAGPVLWTAVGAGLTWATALTGDTRASSK
jgi:3-oxoacyl-[acyl-carrier-protein] synthase-3